MMRVLSVVMCAFCAALVTVGTASSQICSDYDAGDYWIANPVSSSTNYFRNSAAWEDCIVIAVSTGLQTEGNVRVIEFTNANSPRQLSIRDGSYYDVAVEGNLAALCGYGFVDLVDLPTLSLRTRIATEQGYVGAAFQGNRLAVAVNRWLGVYDVAATLASGPVLLEQVTLSGEFATRYFSYTWQRESGVVFAHDVIITWAYGGNNVGGWLGEMLVVRAPADSTLVVTESVDALPGATAATSFPNGAFAMGSGFIVSGFTSSGYPPDYYAGSILAGIHVDVAGHINWGATVRGPSGVSGGVVVAGNQALWSTEPRSLYYSTPFTQNLNVVEFASDLATARITGGSRMFPGGWLSYLPGQGILAIENDTFRLNIWELEPADFGNENGGCRLATLPNGACVLLGWRRAEYMSDLPSWNIQSFDLTGDTPRSIAYIDGDFGSIVEYFATSDYGVFYRDYYSGEIRYYDLRDPAHIGDYVATGLERGYFSTWKNHLVVVNDSTLTVYAPSTDGHQEPIGSIRPVPVYPLTAVGETVYIKSPSGATIIDLVDPTAPAVAGFRAFSGEQLYPFNNALLSIKDQSLTRVDITDPRAPIVIGTQGVGTRITDAVLHGDRLYLSLGRRGTGLYRFTMAEGATPTGGDAHHWSSQIEYVRDRLVVSPGPGFLPLDCSDPLPTLISGFAGVVVPGGVKLSWMASSGPESGWLRVVRFTASGELELCRRPVQFGVDEFTDSDLTAEGTIRYGLDFCTPSGSCSRLAEITVDLGRSSFAPQLTLKAAPNPVRAGTSIEFELAREGAVQCSVFDVSGRRVRVLADRAMNRGPQLLDWDGRDSEGRPVPAGTYVLRIVTPLQTAAMRISVVH